MRHVATLVAAGDEVVLTHGNGPQVGNLLVKNELAAHVVPPVPLDWCVAQTQATIGFTLADELDAALAARGVDRAHGRVVTRTLVDADDPGFRDPTKPVGRYLPRDGGAAVRRARPDLGGPRRAGLAPGRRLARAAGGPRRARDPRAGRRRVRRRLRRRRRHPGGRATPTATLRGVEAVIDKDLTAAMLGARAGRRHARHRHRRPERHGRLRHAVGPPARPGDRRRAARARRGGQFAARQHGPEGRGRPALRRAGRRPRAVITSLEHIADAVARDDAGTVLDRLMRAATRLKGASCARTDRGPQGPARTASVTPPGWPSSSTTG